MTRPPFGIVGVSLGILLAACPPPIPPTPDAAVDAGPNPDRIDACSGGCADNQICDADGGLRGLE